MSPHDISSSENCRHFVACFTIKYPTDPPCKSIVFFLFVTSSKISIHLRASDGTHLNFKTFSFGVRAFLTKSLFMGITSRPRSIQILELNVESTLGIIIQAQSDEILFSRPFISIT